MVRDSGAKCFSDKYVITVHEVGASWKFLVRGSDSSHACRGIIYSIQETWCNVMVL